MEPSTDIVPIKIAGDRVVQIEVANLGGAEDIAISDRLPTFQEVAGTIEDISRAVLQPIEKVKPQRAAVEFGLQVAVQEGQLTALLVQGSGTASLKITLEWGEE